MHRIVCFLFVMHQTCSKTCDHLTVKCHNIQCLKGLQNAHRNLSDSQFLDEPGLAGRLLDFPPSVDPKRNLSEVTEEV